MRRKKIFRSPISLIFHALLIKKRSLNRWEKVFRFARDGKRVMICIIIDPYWTTFIHVVINKFSSKRVLSCISNESGVKMLSEIMTTTIMQSQHVIKFDAKYVLLSSETLMAPRVNETEEALRIRRKNQQITEFYFGFQAHFSSQVNAKFIHSNTSAFA